MKFTAVFLLLLLPACASTPRYTEADAATWGQVGDNAACVNAAPVREASRAEEFFTGSERETLEHNRELWLAEVKRRDLLTPPEWKLVRARSVAAGMSQCALYVSWGPPDAENKTVVPGGVHIQHVYRNDRYVYTLNGRVTSWQTSSSQ